MKTIEELTSFCEGCRATMITFYATLQGVDDWVVWGGYDINFVGADLSDRVKDDELLCDVYRAGWVDDIGEPVHTFIVKGESK